MVLGSPFRRLGRWVAALFLLAFAAVNGWDLWRSTAHAGGIDLPALPTHTFVTGLLLTRLAEVPWQLTGLASAVIAVLVGMWTSHAAISLQRANELKDARGLVRASRPFPWIESLAPPRLPLHGAVLARPRRPSRAHRQQPALLDRPAAAGDDVGEGALRRSHAAGPAMLDQTERGVTARPY